MASQRSVPEYARGNKAEYIECRNVMRSRATFLGFDWVDCWNVMIDIMETRHANVVKGRAKNDLSLTDALNAALKQMAKERAHRDVAAAAPEVEVEEQAS